MVERAERKAFRNAAGVVKSKVVISKDFAGLYALAHEYHEWLNADEYLAADREVLALMQQSPGLVARLRRFENYRKVLYNRLPGPLPQAREKDRWFTEYQTATSFTATDQEQIKEAEHPQRDVIPTKDPPKPLAQDVSKGSPKRITESKTGNRPEGVSFDSASPSSSETSVKNEEWHETSERHHDTIPSLTLAEPMGGQEEPVPLPSLTAIPDVQRERESKRVSGEVTRTGQESATTVGGQPGYSSVLRESQREPSHLLARSFAREIVTPFGDRNPQGTQTRVLSILREAHLDQPADVLLCLIRAYVVARDTRAIRPEHCCPETGQVNRMPLFCAMFQRFVTEHRQGNDRDASWQRVQQAIAADDRLTGWWEKHQFFPGGSLPNERADEPKRSVVLLHDEASEANKGARSFQTPRHRVTHQERASTQGAESAGRSPSGVARSIPEPDDYERYVNALMAHYRAPQEHQEGR